MGNTRVRKRKKRSRTWITLLILLCACAALAALIVYQKIMDPVPSLYEESYASSSLADSDPALIPDYCGEAVIELNGGRPFFTEYDAAGITGENYSELDSLGRCGTAFAMLDRTMMPEDPRGPIGEIRPTGWVQEKYPGIVDSEPPYLYNRCHLIAYSMTGQNANERNLITGTRYMNTESMLPYEVRILRYLDRSDNHVLYRVSPYFKNTELLARGIELEAYSVEDKGVGVCFHVFLYNIQPGIEIDYQTGVSAISLQDAA